MEHNDSRSAQNESNIDKPIVDNEWLEARFSALELRNTSLRRSAPAGSGGWRLAFGDGRACFWDGWTGRGTGPCG
jgi:hypothetical protein